MNISNETLNYIKAYQRAWLTLQLTVDKACKFTCQPLLLKKLLNENGIDYEITYTKQKKTCSFELYRDALLDVKTAIMELGEALLDIERDWEFYWDQEEVEYFNNAIDADIYRKIKIVI